MTEQMQQRQQRTKRRDIALAAILAFLVGVLVGLFLSRSTDFFGHYHGEAEPIAIAPTDPGDTVDGGDDSGNADVHGASLLKISGDTVGLLAPGRTLPIDLSIENPNDFGFTVRHLTVSVIGVSAPRATATRPCNISDFEVSSLGETIEFTLEAGAVESLSSLDVAKASWPTIGMINRPVNQNGCKEATLTLDYKASGLEVYS